MKKMLFLQSLLFILSGCTFVVKPTYIPTGNLSYDNFNLLREMPIKLQVHDERKERIFILYYFNTSIPESGGNYGFNKWKMETSSKEIVEQALSQAMQDYGYVFNEEAPIIFDVEIGEFVYYENRQKSNVFTANIVLYVVVSKANRILSTKCIVSTIDKTHDLFGFQKEPERMLASCLSNVVEKLASDSAIVNGVKKGYGKYIPEEVVIEPKEDERPSESDETKKMPEKLLVFQGTGFLFAENGLVATNYHVVSEREDIRVFFPKTDLKFDAKVELKDISNDLVILKLKDFTYEELFSQEIPYDIQKSKAVRLGEKVFTLGFPLGKLLGKSAKFSDGTISSLSGLMGTANLFQINNPIQPGNSGGPLFNQHGNVIGIVLASLDAKFFYENLDTIPQNVNFAIKSDYLINLISMLPESDSTLSRKGSLQDRATQEQVEAIVPYIITVYAK